MWGRKGGREAGGERVSEEGGEEWGGVGWGGLGAEEAREEDRYLVGAGEIGGERGRGWGEETERGLQARQVISQLAAFRRVSL